MIEGGRFQRHWHDFLVVVYVLLFKYYPGVFIFNQICPLFVS